MRVVPALDPFEHGHPGLGLAPEAPAIEQLAFQRSEEALGHGVVVGISDRSRAHERSDQQNQSFCRLPAADRAAV